MKVERTRLESLGEPGKRGFEDLESYKLSLWPTMSTCLPIYLYTC